ncbi:unnamed protein product [Rhizophagus irregularis]|nr:unnamed protein product [Rhizophagus irregularis]
MKPNFKDQRVERGMEEGDFVRTKILILDQVDFQRSEKGELRSWMSRVSFEEWKKTKIRKFRVGFRRTEKGEPLLRFISGGLLNNGKELRFVNLGGFPKNQKKEPRFVSGGFPKNRKKEPRFISIYES